MVVFYKKIRSEGKKSTERKSDKYGMDKARWHRDVQAVKVGHLPPQKQALWPLSGKKKVRNPRSGRKGTNLLTKKKKGRLANKPNTPAPQPPIPQEKPKKRAGTTTNR
ncbi:hypothetical protein LN01_17655, partial [Salmonella enterica]|uniref:hypothetical protein n=1 Tax=Salmonella enterica TaxID=28901 RepID=UPI000D770BD2